MAAAAMPRLRLAPGAVLARGTLLWERGHEQLNSHVSNPELKERAHLARPHEKQQLLPPSPGVITPTPPHTHTHGDGKRAHPAPMSFVLGTRSSNASLRPSGL